MWCRPKPAMKSYFILLSSWYVAPLSSWIFQYLNILFGSVHFRFLSIKNIIWKTSMQKFLLKCQIRTFLMTFSFMPYLYLFNSTCSSYPQSILVGRWRMGKERIPIIAVHASSSDTAIQIFCIFCLIVRLSDCRSEMYFVSS